MGTHGVNEQERLVAQEFLIDIQASSETRKAAESDNLSDAVDYRKFIEIAEGVLAGPPCKLIESLADMMASRILRDVRISDISVTIQKTTVFKNGTPGITVFRRQNESV